MSEVQAALDAEEEHGRLYPSSYYVHLVDSQVAAACLIKGRSSSWQLNRLLRRSIVSHLCHGCKPFYGYIRSQYNPGDDPTRGVEVRSPMSKEAVWLTRLKAGDPDGMDEFLNSIGLGLRQMAGLPDPNEIMADAPYDYKNSKKVKEDRGRLHRHPPRKNVAEKVKVKQVQDQPSDSVEPLLAETQKVMQSEERFQSGGSSSSTASAKKPLEIVAAQTGYNWSVLLQLFRRSQFVFSKKFPDLETALQSGPGLLDLFSGARGFAKSFTQSADTWAVCFDLKHHEDENLLSADLQRILLQLISKGFFSAMASVRCAPAFQLLSLHLGGHWLFQQVDLI